ncbi:TPA: restriction endonuclease [Bacillus toyonensis]|nr:restriction endonuclease [Bacillus toyonensis]
MEDYESVTIEVIDAMDGYQFEEFVAQLFQDMGYKTEVASGSGDYGIDVIARRKGLNIGIQAKWYSDKVPNKDVQEVIAGIAFYNLDRGLVITNNYYTKQAQNQAKSTNVLLWDRDILQQKLREVYGDMKILTNENSGW